MYEESCIFMATLFVVSQVELLRAAFQVLAVGEWSLARRFLQWITGQVDVFDSIDLTYFRTHVSV